MPRPDSKALGYLYDKFVGTDPELVADYEAACAELAAYALAYDAPPACRCLDAGGCPGLAAGKLYRRLPDADAESEGLWRVVDASGEDYLFAAELFKMEQADA